MAVSTSHSDPYFQFLPKCCSICGDPLRPPFIYWEAKTILAAHPNCVEPVAWALFTRCLGTQDRPWTDRALYHLFSEQVYAASVPTETLHRDGSALETTDTLHW